jgi:hypothetical protein
MRRANWVSIVVGVALGAAGLGGLVGMLKTDVQEAERIEAKLHPKNEATAHGSR